MVRHVLEPTQDWGNRRRLEEDRENKALNLRFKDDFGPRSDSKGLQTDEESMPMHEPTMPMQEPPPPAMEYTHTTPKRVTVLDTPRAPKKKMFTGPLATVKRALRKSKIINTNGQVLDFNSVAIRDSNIEEVLEYAKNPVGPAPQGTNEVGKWFADSGRKNELISRDFISRYKPATRLRPKPQQEGKGWKIFWKGF